MQEFQIHIHRACYITAVDKEREITYIHMQQTVPRAEFKRL